MKLLLTSPVVIANSADSRHKTLPSICRHYPFVLRHRLVFGLSIIAILAALCWADANCARPGIFLVPLAITLCLLATHEMINILRASGSNPLLGSTYLGTLMPVLGACVPTLWTTYPENCPLSKIGWLALGLAMGLLIAIIAEMRRFSEPGKTVAQLAATGLSIFYVGGLLGFLIQLRLLHDSSWGLAALLSVILTVKLSDTCQYTFGKLLGKHKLIPKLSPGKTWEGTLYGMTSAVIIAALLLCTILGNLGTEQSFLKMILFCTLVAVAGIVGDLAESKRKRDVGFKDSSRWLPGLGGILDLLDSLLVAAPVGYFCWVAGLIGP